MILWFLEVMIKKKKKSWIGGSWGVAGDRRGSADPRGLLVDPPRCSLSLWLCEFLNFSKRMLQCQDIYMCFTLKCGGRGGRVLGRSPWHLITWHDITCSHFPLLSTVQHLLQYVFWTICCVVAPSSGDITIELHVCCRCTVLYVYLTCTVRVLYVYCVLYTYCTCTVRVLNAYVSVRACT